MIGYYSFLANGMNITSVLWTEVYSDSQLNVDTATAVLPVYIPKGNNSSA